MGSSCDDNESSNGSRGGERIFQYVFREQRLVCFFIGFSISFFLFSVFDFPMPSSSLITISSHHIHDDHDSFAAAESTHVSRRVAHELHGAPGMRLSTNL